MINPPYLYNYHLRYSKMGKKEVRKESANKGESNA
jgi:hypothetical protein